MTKGRAKHQLENIQLAFDHVRNWSLAVDAGANIGLWAEAMAKRFDKVLAFEPGKDVFEVLHKLEDNCSNLYCIDMALGDKVCEIDLVSLPKKVRQSQR